MLSLAIAPRNKAALVAGSMLVWLLGLGLFSLLDVSSGVLWGTAPVVVVGALWGMRPVVVTALIAWGVGIAWTGFQTGHWLAALQAQGSGLLLLVVGVVCGFWHKMEKAAKKAEYERDIFTTALKDFDEPLEILSQSGALLYVNSAWERLAGYTSAEVVNTKEFATLHPSPRDAQLQEALRDAKSLRWRGELSLAGKGGTTQTFQATASWMQPRPGDVHAVVRLQDLRNEREREQKLRMFQALPDIVLQVDFEGELLHFKGPTSLEDKIVTGVSLLAAIPTEVMPSDVAHQALQLVYQTLQTGESAQLEFPLRIEARRQDFVARFIPNQESGEVLIFVREISDRKQLERALGLTQHSFRNIIERNQDGIIIIDHAGIVRFTNPAAVRFFHHGGARLGELFDYPLIVGASTEIEIVLQVREDGFEVTGTGEMRLTETRWVDGDAYLASIRDITERKHAETKLQHQAYHDLLTGLPNRALFLERLEQAIALRKQNPSFLFAVLFMDLDRFKNVNDSLGHDAGDQLLMDIALRLGQSVRISDTVSRLGGDEFVVLLGELHNEKGAIAAAEQVLASFVEPFSIKGNTIYTSASIGIALGESSYALPQDMLRDADTAMYRAKELGKSRYIVFDREMHLQAQRLLRLENELKRAIENDEFVFHLQPIIGLQTELLTGFEVLVRWQHPEDGMVYPGDFIEVAEDTGLIVPIGWWIMREACHLFARWQRQWPDALPLSVSVNLSAKQIGQHDLVTRVLDILHETGLPPQYLKLEITESALIDQVEIATAMLSELRDHGLQIHMDDFGTGYSSLSYLHRFPLDGLKVDRAFVNGMETSKENAEIVRAIVFMAQSLGLSVTAEGAENLQQVGMLRALGCERVQGYVMSRPVSIQAAEVIAQNPGGYASLLHEAVKSRSSLL